MEKDRLSDTRQEREREKQRQKKTWCRRKRQKAKGIYTEREKLFIYPPFRSFLAFVALKQRNQSMLLLTCGCLRREVTVENKV